jgi:hypothetical protein
LNNGIKSSSGLNTKEHYWDTSRPLAQHITTFSRNRLKMEKSLPEPAGLTAARNYIAIKNNTQQTRQSGTKRIAVSMDKEAKRWGGSSFAVYQGPTYNR